MLRGGEGVAKAFADDLAPVEKASRWRAGLLPLVVAPPIDVAGDSLHITQRRPRKPRHFHYSVIWNYRAPAMDWQGVNDARLLARAASRHAKAGEALAKCLAKRGPR